MKGKWFGEFFAGCGIISKAVRALGFSTREWELLRGQEGDLTRQSVLRPVRQSIDRGELLAAFLAPPCGSFSIINASVRRSSDDPWGLGPQSTDKARASVSLGNSCMKSAIQIIRWLEKKQIPWILEHPQTSRAWYLPFFIQLLQKRHIVACDLDQCQYGTKWRKSTRLITSRIDANHLSRLTRRCSRDEKGFCGRSHCPHIQLRGTHPSGKPWTSLASAYPRSLADNVAFCLLDPFIHTYPGRGR